MCFTPCENRTRGVKNTLNDYRPQYKHHEGKSEAEKEIEKKLAGKFK